QSTVGQFQVIGQHDNGHLRPDLFDLIGDSCTVQEAEVVLEDDGIYGPRREKPQAIGTVGSGCQLVSVFLQQTQFELDRGVYTTGCCWYPCALCISRK